MAEADDEKLALSKTENGRSGTLIGRKRRAKVLYCHEALTDFMGNMEPRSEFNAIMMHSLL